jgi:hypothetical protein
MIKKGKIISAGTIIQNCFKLSDKNKNNVKLFKQRRPKQAVIIKQEVNWYGLKISFFGC